MSRSRGAVLLARTCKEHSEISARAEVSRITVSKWVNGHAKPALAKRDVLLEAFDIPIEAWDEAPTKPGKIPPPTTPVHPSAHSMIVELERMAYDFMAQVRQDEEMSPLEKARVMSALSVTLNHLEKRTGDIGARLFELPVWKRIEKAIETVLDGHPEIAIAMARELRKAETG